MLTNYEIERAIACLKDGSIEGDATEQWVYANHLLSNSKSDIARYQLGIDLLKRAAANGHTLAQGELAFRLYYGEGIDKDEQLALEFCNQALEHWKRPQWERLHKIITRPKNLILSNSQLALYRAFLHHDSSYIESRLDENVIFSDLLRYPTEGKKDVIECLEKCILDKNVQTSLISTERYGMVTEIFSPNEVRNTIRSIYLMRSNSDNKINRIARQPIVWNEFCFNVGSEPFYWEEIEPCLKAEIKTFNRGLMFCMGCGKLSHELKWIRFQSNPELHEGFFYTGKMSVCPDCRQQVEFHCDCCERR